MNENRLRIKQLIPYRLSCFMLFYLIPFLFFGQSISGIVTDESKQPLPGATVLLKGTSVGTVTDFDGQFNLDITSNTDSNILVISFLGYTAKEVNFTGSKNNIIVVLKEDVSTLDEVVLN